MAAGSPSRNQPDTILVLMTADPDEIRARMKAAPHKFPLVPPGTWRRYRPSS